jgi:glycosyltransferase involved in cell wall biosynthesis
MIRPTSLYISYDGLLEPLGQSQVLPYVEGLADRGIAFTLLTFEKAADLARADDVRRLRERLAPRRIRWVALRYHKAPSVPATAWDIICGSLVGAWLAWRTRARVIHVRSYVAGLMGLAARAASGARFVFDMRGFWPEERVEGGLWPPGGRLFRLAKRAERALLRAADAVIVLTEQARRIVAGGAYRAALSPRARVAVIPCCVDLHRFAAPNVWETHPLPHGPRTLVYAGSVGTWYMLTEMLDFHRAVRARDPELGFLILNRGDHDVIAAAVAATGAEGVRVLAATPDEIPGHLRQAWAGLYFIKPVFSKKGASPTKLGEYLAAGLPVVVNAGVGDADEMVAAAGVGVVVERFAREEYLTRWDALEGMATDPGLRGRCRETARRTLALDGGVARYHEVYDELTATGPRPSAVRASPRPR